LSALGVVCALDWEAACLPQRADRLQVVTCGIGAPAARAAARHLLGRGVSALVSFGSAGALDPGLRAGRLLIPIAVRDARGNEVGVDSRFRGMIATMLRERGFAVDERPLLQVDAAVTTPAEKAALRQCQWAAGSAAVDMESIAVAIVAAAAGVPFAGLRVVLDEAGQGLPSEVLASLDSRGRPVAGRLLAALAKRPGLLLDLWRLAAAQRRTIRSLRAAGSALQACAAGPDGQRSAGVTVDSWADPGPR